MRYLIPLLPGQVRLQASGRQIQLVVPNYFRVYPEGQGFVNSDGSVNVFSVEASPDQVNVVQEGASQQHLLWKGNKNSRDNHADLVTVAVECLISPAVSAESVALKEELAQAQARIVVLTAQLGAEEDKVRVAGVQVIDLQSKLEANFAAAEKAIAEAKAGQVMQGRAAVGAGNQKDD